jgi:hypothetical protein
MAVKNDSGMEISLRLPDLFCDFFDLLGRIATFCGGLSKCDFFPIEICQFLEELLHLHPAAPMKNRRSREL